MTSLLFGSASACTCPHHEEAKASESDYHSRHESAQNVEIYETRDAVDDSCICVIEQPSPYVASRSVSKEFRSNDRAASSEQAVIDLEFMAIAKSGESSPHFTDDLSYLNTLKSLLPSRAPPRL